MGADRRMERAIESFAILIRQRIGYCTHRFVDRMVILHFPNVCAVLIGG